MEPPNNDHVTAAHASGLMPFLLSLAGSIVALRGVPGSGWKDRWFNLLCGTLLGGILGPAIAEWFNLESANLQSACHFLVGLFGLNVVATIVEWIRNVQLSDVLPWLSRGRKE